jgi:cytochrome c556
MPSSKCLLAKRVMAVAVVWASAQALFSQPPADKPISAYAPADDLIGQVDYYIAQAEERLADPKAYDLAKQSRTWKDANTLAVLALVLANHDEPHPLKPAMPAILTGAKALAASDDKVAQAQEALATIKSARAGMSEPGGQIKSEQVASVAALMKQVPLVHAGLRRAVAPNRLARMAKESASQAATLAAIAQVTMQDREYGKTPEAAAQWSAFCAAMRDASGEVNSAVHARDQARVDAGMKRLLESCDACHARFRQQ